MRKLRLLTATAALLLAAAPALGQIEIFEIDAIAIPEHGTGMIPIVPCQWIDLVAHVDKGHPGTQWHIDEVSMRFTSDLGTEVEHHVPDGGMTATIALDNILVDWEFDPGVEPCNWITECEWFPWGRIHVADGRYCDTFTVQADIWLTGQPEKMWSNTLTFHIVPEPGTLAMVGAGLLAMIGLARRR